MSSRSFWKLALTVIVLAWSLITVLPIKDTPFEDYIRTRATANQEKFNKLLDRAEYQVAQDKAPSLFMALKQIGQEERIDYTEYFTDINLTDVSNLNKRNDFLLNHLLQQSQGKIRQGLDLKGGVSFTLEIDPAAQEGKPEDQKLAQLDKAIQIMSRRIDGLGVAEPIIRAKGSQQIEIQLPGISTKDNPEVVNALKKPAKLEFRFLHPDSNMRPDRMPEENYPIGYEVMVYEQMNHNTGEIYETPLFVKQIPALTGKAIAEAYPYMNNFGGYEIGLTMTTAGGERFAEITRDNIGRQLGIVLDGNLYSAPVINSEIPNGRANISGNFTQRDAIELSNVLNNPLEFELRLKEMYEIGPSLASDARDSSINAALLGAGLVVAFMLFYYLGAGLLAILSVSLNVLMVLAILASVKATMTLPGVAALVLTIGMGVDANILIFERIREELRDGKPVGSALLAGYDKAFSTILDANLTTLLAAGILIWLGTGPIKGFGVTLAIGIVASMFCALVVSRGLLEISIDTRLMKKLIPYSLFKPTNFDFLKYRRSAFAISWIVVLMGAIFVWQKGENIYGIDFRGGDELTVSFVQKPDITDIEDIVQNSNLGEVIPVYRHASTTTGELLKIQTEEGRGLQVLEVLSESFPESNFELIAENSIGASVSSNLKSDALLAVGVSLLGILLYIAFRFEMGYGMGAIVSTIHDVVMTIGIFVMLGGQFTAPMVAAILMIVGYSINDTIVVFDRIREELIMHPTMPLNKLINLAINRTLSRTLLTSFTTFLAAIALYLFGAGQIDDFALVFLIGIVTGTFSSIFIASPVFFWWHKGDRRRVEQSKEKPTYHWEASSKASAK